MVVDAEGTDVKVLTTPHKRLEIPSYPKMKPAKMAATVRAATAGWNHTPKKPISRKVGAMQ